MSGLASRVQPGKAVGVDLLWIALVAAICALMWWASTKIDPHWASRDGSRFIALAQPLTPPHYVPAGRTKEVRVAYGPNDHLIVQRRRGVRAAQVPYLLANEMPATEGKGPKKRQFLLKPIGGKADEPTLLLRLPASSPTAERLATMLNSAVK